MRKKYKIQMLGGNPKEGKQAQCYIAIPMKWFNEHELEKGDELEVSILTMGDEPVLQYRIT